MMWDRARIRAGRLRLSVSPFLILALFIVLVQDAGGAEECATFGDDTGALLSPLHPILYSLSLSHSLFHVFTSFPEFTVSIDEGVICANGFAYYSPPLQLLGQANYRFSLSLSPLMKEEEEKEGHKEADALAYEFEFVLRSSPEVSNFTNGSPPHSLSSSFISPSLLSFYPLIPISFRLFVFFSSF